MYKYWRSNGQCQELVQWVVVVTQTSWKGLSSFLWVYLQFVYVKQKEGMFSCWSDCQKCILRYFRLQWFLALTACYLCWLPRLVEIISSTSHVLWSVILGVICGSWVPGSATHGSSNFCKTHFVRFLREHGGNHLICDLRELMTSNCWMIY